MTTSELLAQITERVQRPFLVIGGHAVIAHGYPRTTVDLDLMVRRREREIWLTHLRELNYEVEHVQDTFAQLTSTVGDIDLDLMFANDPTFDGMLSDSVAKPGGTMNVRVPSLQHLIALKLHVLKQGLRHRVLPDLDDVIELVLANGLDLREEKWRRLFDKYGNMDLYEKVRHATQR